MLQLIPAILLMLLSSSGQLDRTQASAWPEALRILGLEKTDDDSACPGTTDVNLVAFLNSDPEVRSGFAAAIIRWLTTPMEASSDPIDLELESAALSDRTACHQKPSFRASLVANPFRAGPDCA